MNPINTKSLMLTLITVSLISIQGLVFAGDNDAEAIWVMTGDSPLLDRSSKYLYNGKTKAGIKYAQRALARSQSKYAQAIARHNLCIAYVQTGEVGLAGTHCAEARNTTIPDSALKKIKPGLYKIVRNKKKMSGTPGLGFIIAQNLENHGLDKDFPRLAQTN